MATEPTDRPVAAVAKDETWFTPPLVVPILFLALVVLYAVLKPH